MPTRDRHSPPRSLALLREGLDLDILPGLGLLQAERSCTRQFEPCQEGAGQRRAAAQRLRRALPVHARQESFQPSTLRPHVQQPRDPRQRVGYAPEWRSIQLVRVRLLRLALSGPLFSETVVISATFTRAGSVLQASSQIQAAPQPTRVPEPMSLALLGTGLAGMGLIRRSKAS